MSNDGEWQVAGRRGNRPRRGHRGHPPTAMLTAAVLAEEAGEEGAGKFRGNPNPQLSVADMTNDHDRHCRVWRESPSSERLRTIFSDNVADHVPIETAICFGLGSFDPGPERSSWQRAAHIQFEAFLVIVRILEQHSGKKIKCYAQEPTFVPKDKEYLESLDIEPVDNPHAFQYVNSRTFVYGVHLPHKVWNYIFKDRLPGLCVGTNKTSLESFSIIRDQEAWDQIDMLLERIRQMESSFDKFVFPEAADGDYTFSGTDIYWAKKEVDGEGARGAVAYEEGSETALQDGAQT